MTLAQLRNAVLRTVFSLFLLLTSAYCLLAYVPFTYQQVHVAGLLPWLTTFVKIHTYLYWLALAVVFPAILPDLRQSKTKVLGYIFFWSCVAVGVRLLRSPLLLGLQNDFQSFEWALASLVPVAWLALIDWVATGSKLQWKPSQSVEDARVFHAAWQSALFAMLVYAGIFYFRRLDPADTRLPSGAASVSLAWSLASHLLLFMGVFLGLVLLRGVASFLRRPKLEFLLYVVAAGLLIAMVIHSLVFRQISFSGPAAIVYSLAFGFCAAACFAGLGLRLYPPSETVESGLTLLLTPLRWPSFLPSVACLLPLALIAILAYLLQVRIALLDWNYLLQKLVVLGVWTAGFANLYDLSLLSKRREGVSALRIGGLLLVAIAVLGAYRALSWWQPEFRRPPSHRIVNVAEVLDAYSAYDISFKLVDETLSPARSDSSFFYRFLSRNTNIPRSVPTHPADVDLVEHLTPATAPKPDIFIIVIDSLRRDYLSSYNSAVNFTPSIEAFGRESVVMQNAFTRYGGTGLSEPSIWVGGMLLHQQYVTPFYPMNALAKMLETDGYKGFISRDAILSTIVPSTSAISELDPGTSEKDLDLCTSLSELQGKIDGESDPNAALFAYTQPQNIHISVIHREGESVPPGESYPGFYAPYASRIKRMDACFGKFVQFLKDKGRYDKSIVVLTADHGDSLGEGGRWGHAYTLFPEIVEIPLIIHLPPALRSALAVDSQTLAFLTDITPTLYYLLGHRPIVHNELFGRPLFMEKAGDENPYLRDSYLLASSYGPVYGVLANRGQSLYVADGVNYKDYLFDLKDSVGGNRRVSPQTREDDERIIQNGITAISHFYHFE